MSRGRYLAYRIAWTIIGAWGALTGIFLVYALTPDPGQFQMGGGTAAYRAARNYDEPLLGRYLTWLESFATLDLGTTVRGTPIVDVLAEASTVTLTYLVPSVALAVVVGVGVGTFVAMNPESRLLRAARGLSYLGFSIPTFLAAETLFIVSIDVLKWHDFRFDPQQAIFTARNLSALALPAMVLTVNLLAVQLRYARAESIEILQEDFVKTLRASGADTTEFARHVLKNAASSLLSLFFSEMVGVTFVVLVVVEVVFGIPGFGQLLFRGIHDRDVGIILATTIFPILLVTFGNLIQDVAYALIDPRVESDRR